MTTTRKLLPIISDGPHGSRSAVTCLYRCGNACFHPEPNTSDNPHVSTLIEGALARRAVLRGAAVGAGALVVGSAAIGSAAAAPDPDTARGGDRGHDHGDGDSVATDRWTPVEPNVRDELTVPPGYTTTVVASWGDPVEVGAPPFDPAKQTPESAAKQFGYNNDYLGILPLDRKHSLLVCNHEYTNPELMFPEAAAYDDLTKLKIELESHGMAVVKIKKRRNGSFERVHPRESAYNRRITGNSKFRLAGPAAGDARLKTTADPSGTTVLGTLGNCAGGMTPWGTVLSGEENFNFFFDSSTGTTDPRYAASYKRYGIVAAGKGLSKIDPRFDLSKEPHEPFRFGWIVEIDPYDRRSTPRKQTMLGRFKHEGANVIISDDGHAVCYMGDDERGDYMYKFVSKNRYRRGDSTSARRSNMQLLTEGTLYVAKFTGDGTADGEFDGTGEWIALTTDQKSFVAGMSVADVLINTRLAADTVTPTKMDRPEDVEPNPVNGRIYAALTNNSNRGTTFPVDETNPIGESHTRAQLDGPLVKQSGNRNGYVLELTEDRGDHTGTKFHWLLLLVCGDPEAPETYFAGFPKDKVSPISCPDNVAFDTRGNLWIATDGSVLGGHDGIFRVPLKGSRRGQVQQFLTVPVAAEACGPFISHDDQAVWVAVQHPGEATGSTHDQPVSTWPHTHDFPRPSVAVAHRR